MPNQVKLRFSRSKKWLIWLVLFLSSIFFALGINLSQTIPVVAQNNLSSNGKVLYDAGQFSQAATVLEQAVRTYQAQGDNLRAAIAFSNLSLAYQQLGLWSQAEEAITKSLELLQEEESPNSLKIIAQSLNIQGRLQFSQGQVETALETWRQAAATYGQTGNELGVIRSQLNQAQALQNLGFYRGALKLLSGVEQKLDSQPDSVTKAASLRSLGDVLQLMGNLTEAHTALEASLTIARTLQSPPHISAALLSLGNIARTQRDTSQALSFYQQAAQASASPMVKVQSQLNQLSLFIDTGDVSAAQTLVTKIESQLESLIPSRNTVYARINLAESLLKMGKLGNGEVGKWGEKQSSNSNEKSATSIPNIANHLAVAVRQAEDLGDQRAHSYALGILGSVYEQNHQWQEAQQLTEQALLLSVTINAPDLSYRWQWQLGRLLEYQGDEQSAIAAYETAIDLLKSLRSDLVAINADVQFSFRESVEPVYRELVSLLLKDNEKQSNDAKNLEKARKVIESLQLAELDNFFRSACLNANPVEIDQVDQQAAIIYPIILPDRLEVILSLPNQGLRHYSQPLTPQEVEKVTKSMRRTVTNRLRKNFLPSAIQVYDWLIRPIEKDLVQADVETLVFVLDGVLRNIPMAALYDGEQYLVEKYSIAVTPGLELLESQPLELTEVKVLTVGLSEGRQGFNPLPGVEVELSKIGTHVESEVLLNDSFTENNVQVAMDAISYPIVHFATHGTFSSNAEDTFILTWDDKINVHELNSLLRTNDVASAKPIELLVFSACETANGDQRAALGIAGIAVRAGARSTIASLWSVNDQATSEFMVKFYQGLANPEVTKAQALRDAQLSILQDPQYRGHPYFWAPFILVGNWL